MRFPSLPRALLVPAILALAPLPAAEKSPADAAFDAARAAIVTSSPAGETALEAGFTFLLGFPEDPRTRGLLPALEALAERLPEAARAGYREAYARRIAAALARPDLPAPAREGILSGIASAVLSRELEAEQPDPAALAGPLRALAEQFPQSRALPALRLGEARLLAARDPAAGLARLRALAADPDPELARQAAAEVRVAQLRTEPLELKFTAADGREVDVARLRGKVVLIDFWATWCGPCVAEIPNMLEQYEKYHAQGFEVVGISLDEEKDKVDAFIAEHKIPWPIIYVGKGWQDPTAQFYGISGIPQLILIGRDGNVITLNARGKKLGDRLAELFKDGG